MQVLSPNDILKRRAHGGVKVMAMNFGRPLPVPEVKPKKRPKPKQRVCPQTAPVVMFLVATSDTHRLRILDPLRPSSQGKPIGVRGIELFRALGRVRDLPLSEARYIGTFSRMRIELPIPEEAHLYVTTYYARWAGANGQVGPLSLPACL